jgi:hypothetical protein
MAVESGSTSASAPQPAGQTSGQLTASSAMLAGAGLISSIGAGYSYKAQGYMQQASYAIQATENMRMASLRADKDVEYANIAYERKQKQIELESLNFKIQGNTLLRSLNKANAATRARAYANGMSGSSGSALSMANANVRNTHRDLAVIELNALASRVFGMEDATNILRSGYDQAYYTRESAIGSTRSALAGGGFAAQTGGLMAGASLVQGAMKFAETVPAGYVGQKITNLFNG